MVETWVAFRTSVINKNILFDGVVKKKKCLCVLKRMKRKGMVENFEVEEENS